MNCPYCGNQMERGELVSGNGIHWRSFSPSGDRPAGMPLIKPTAKAFFKAFTKGFSVEACHCPHCKKIILSHE